MVLTRNVYLHIPHFVVWTGILLIVGFSSLGGGGGGFPLYFEVRTETGQVIFLAFKVFWFPGSSKAQTLSD